MYMSTMFYELSRSEMYYMYVRDIDIYLFYDRNVLLYCNIYISICNVNNNLQIYFWDQLF